jgi:hypothetical protein
MKRNLPATERNFSPFSFGCRQVSFFFSDAPEVSLFFLGSQTKVKFQVPLFSYAHNSPCCHWPYRYYLRLSWHLCTCRWNHSVQKHFLLSPRKQDRKVTCFAKFSNVTYTTCVIAQFCVFCRCSEIFTVPDGTHWCVPSTHISVVWWQRAELLFRTYPDQMKLGLQSTTLKTSAL